MREETQDSCETHTSVCEKTSVRSLKSFSIFYFFFALWCLGGTVKY